MSFCPSIHLSASVRLSVCLYVCISIFLLSVAVSLYVYLSVCLSFLPICLPICLSLWFLKFYLHLSVRVLSYYIPFSFMDLTKCLDRRNGAVRFTAISLSQVSTVFSSIVRRSVKAEKYGWRPEFSLCTDAYSHFETFSQCISNRASLWRLSVNKLVW